MIFNCCDPMQGLPVDCHQPELFNAISTMVEDLGAELSEQELALMRAADERRLLWGDVTPIENREDWYRVRIGVLDRCIFFSIQSNGYLKE